MHGFPLTFNRISRRMHKGKLKFATESAAREAVKFHGKKNFYLSVLLHVSHQQP